MDCRVASANSCCERRRVRTARKPGGALSILDSIGIVQTMIERPSHAARTGPLPGEFPASAILGALQTGKTMLTQAVPPRRRWR